MSSSSHDTLSAHRDFHCRGMCPLGVLLKSTVGRNFILSIFRTRVPVRGVDPYLCTGFGLSASVEVRGRGQLRLVEACTATSR